MKIYLIRHGQPEVAQYAGFPGPELGALGHQQALAIRDFLTDCNINRVLCSDYTRALQTAQPFLAAHPALPWSIAPALRERENETETHESLVQRVQHWFANALPQFQHQNIALFGHCGSVNMILDHVDPEQTLLHYPYTDKYGCHTPTGGVWALELNGAGHVQGELVLRQA